MKVANPMDAGNPMNPEKCTATNRQGKRCGRYPIPGGRVCRNHGGAAPQVKAAAMERLKAMQPKALQTIEMLMGSNDFPTVQFQAAKAVIEWTEGKPRESKQVELIATLNGMTDEELRERALALAGA
jgi:hypothetical protein